MVANLLTVAGVNHVITIDLHASQMQGFFKCPVDNLVAEPLIARWIKTHISNWHEAVVVSKNAGGTKRVTSLADALKLSFGIVTTDRRRPQGHGLSESYSMAGSMILDKLIDGLSENRLYDVTKEEEKKDAIEPAETPLKDESEAVTPNGAVTPSASSRNSRAISQPEPLKILQDIIAPLPLLTPNLAPIPDTPESLPANDLRRSRTEPADLAILEEEFTDEVSP
jgi:ribose-phosphate pyrophosphokinase